jgi:hypothetical protein
MEDQLQATMASLSALTDSLVNHTEVLGDHQFDDSVWQMFHTLPAETRTMVLRMLPCADFDEQNYHVCIDKLPSALRAHVERMLQADTACSWCHQAIPLAQMHTHLLQQCEQMTIRCQWSGCGTMMRRSEMDHEKRCPHQQLHCPFCEALHTRETLKDHHCPQEPLQCAFCRKSIRRRQMEAHLLACPLAMVECKWVGCRAQVVRRDLAEHETSQCEHRIEGCSWCKAMLPSASLAAHRLACPLRPLTCDHCGETIQASGLISTDKLLKDHVILQHWQPAMEEKIRSHCMQCPGCDEVTMGRLGSGEKSCRHFQEEMRAFQAGHCDHTPHSMCFLCRQFTQMQHHHMQRCTFFKTGQTCLFPICPNFPVKCFWKGCSDTTFLCHRKEHEQICEQKLVRCPHCIYVDSETNFHIMTPLQLKAHLRSCALHKTGMLHHARSCLSPACPKMEDNYSCIAMKSWLAHYRTCRQDPRTCAECAPLMELDDDIEGTTLRRQTTS